ncbi:MarR family winged helix-turn-helix transcriptional regulator [Paraclostridium bifermentans]|uniref:MarR family winged helix-turn-helix transcriptional regulator n=1 Tax=Paraclostridium bifermentans TaxID=1490 RepID=UPI00040B9C05|nr:MarR family transcriptional regulator [Paraclostridium bifermentans]MCE9675146.1 MarR family transcriptional regulator [Paraclostridium bifermentans]MCU9809927.1 MarR family transcriptional regulator [Paraclostridium sp. AKS46]MDV8112793.1 MarR family transcriptional regulator [Bacillus sp. BAU-SS-2023]
MKKDCNYIGRYISQIHRRGGSFISKELSGLGVGAGQFMFLLELYRGDGRSQEDLAETLNIDKGTTARAIKKLEEEGFLTREKDEIDKRAYKLYLTDKGKNVKGSIYEVLSKWEVYMTTNLTEEESKLVRALLQKICMTI